MATPSSHHLSLLLQIVSGHESEAIAFHSKADTWRLAESGCLSGGMGGTTEA